MSKSIPSINPINLTTSLHTCETSFIQCSFTSSYEQASEIILQHQHHDNPSSTSPSQSQSITIPNITIKNLPCNSHPSINTMTFHISFTNPITPVDRACAVLIQSYYELITRSSSASNEFNLSLFYNHYHYDSDNSNLIPLELYLIYVKYLYALSYPQNTSTTIQSSALSSSTSLKTSPSELEDYRVAFYTALMHLVKRSLKSKCSNACILEALHLLLIDVVPLLGNSAGAVVVSLLNPANTKKSNVNINVNGAIDNVRSKLACNPAITHEGLYLSKSLIASLEGSAKLPNMVDGAGGEGGDECGWSYWRGELTRMGVELDSDLVAGDGDNEDDDVRIVMPLKTFTTTVDTSTITTPITDTTPSTKNEKMLKWLSRNIIRPYITGADGETKEERNLRYLTIGVGVVGVVGGVYFGRRRRGKGGVV